MLLRLLSYSAQNCYAIYDAITFVLMLEQSDWEALLLKKHPLGYVYEIVGEWKPGQRENAIASDKRFESFLKAITAPFMNEYEFLRKIYIK